MPAKRPFRRLNPLTFLAGTEVGENVPRWPLCPGFHQRSADTAHAESRPAEYAARRGWTITVQVREVNSGAAKREAREKLLEAARRREIDVVLVWRLDRWGRSVPDLLATLQELEHLGVGFVSLTEALDLTTPAGRAMAGLLAISRSSNGRSWASELARALPTPARMVNVSAGLQRRPHTRPRSGNSTAPASVSRRSLAGCRSDGPPCAAFWSQNDEEIPKRPGPGRPYPQRSHRRCQSR